MVEGSNPPLSLRVFTHPACSGCGNAVRRAAEIVERHANVELRTVRLEEESGLAEARREHVRTIPTSILARDGDELGRWIGTPEASIVESAIEAARATS